VLEGCQHVQDYLRLVEQYPAPIRMVKGHVHKLVRLCVCVCVCGCGCGCVRVHLRICACGGSVDV